MGDWEEHNRRFRICMMSLCFWGCTHKILFIQFGLLLKLRNWRIKSSNVGWLMMKNKFGFSLSKWFAISNPHHAISWIPNSTYLACSNLVVQSHQTERKSERTLFMWDVKETNSEIGMPVVGTTNLIENFPHPQPKIEIRIKNWNFLVLTDQKERKNLQKETNFDRGTEYPSLPTDGRYIAFIFFAIKRWKNSNPLKNKKKKVKVWPSGGAVYFHTFVYWIQNIYWSLQ